MIAENGSKEYFYIRSGSSSIIAKGEVLDELRELAKRYTVKRAFPGWNPQKVIRQTEKKARKLMKRLQ